MEPTTLSTVESQLSLPVWAEDHDTDVPTVRHWLVSGVAAGMVLVSITIESGPAIAAVPQLDPLRVGAYEYGDKAPLQFAKLCAEWKAASAHLSSVTAMAMLPSYLGIIAMGRPAIPLILRQIEAEGDRPDHWFLALQALAHADPVRLADHRSMKSAANAWIEWGKTQGYIR